MVEKLESANDEWINNKLKFLKNIRSEFVGDKKNHDLVLRIYIKNINLLI